MALFAIADTHLSLGDDKPMDIFPGWDGYVQRLEKKWRELVRDEDTVVIAGDVSWAMSLEKTVRDFTFLNSLPGRKLLFKGNHDYWWTTRKKMDEFLSKNGFDSLTIVHNSAEETEDYVVCGTRGWFYGAGEKNGMTGESGNELENDRRIILREAGRLEMSLCAAEKTGKQPVAFLHYPPFYGDVVCDEIMNVLEKHGVRLCYYGHLHGLGVHKIAPRELRGVKLTLVSCDAVGFTPVLVR